MNISSKLFIENKVEIPEWMDKVSEVEIKEKQTFEIDYSPKGVFEDNSINRTEVTANIRGMQNNYNKTKLSNEAQILLAKFLIGKHYKILEQNITDNRVVITARIDKLPSDIIFPFTVIDSKLDREATFIITDNNCEYPFSNAGLNEYIQDLRNNKVKQSKKIESVYKTHVISREEIVRRFNGKLREATDKIDELVSEGSLIGVGSNEYASIYDIDQLIPSEEKVYEDNQMSSFNFIENKEHVAAKPKKHAKTLAVEASKELNRHFKNFTIKSYCRDNDELLVKASLINPDNNTYFVADFSFNIQDEIVRDINFVELNDERYSIAQLKDVLSTLANDIVKQYKENNVIEKTASSIVITKKTIEKNLSKVIDRNKVDIVVAQLINKKLIKPINSTTYASDYTFEELLNNVNVEMLSKEELSAMNKNAKHFGEGMDSHLDNKYFGEIKDIEANEQLIEKERLLSAQRHIQKLFNKFNIYTNEYRQDHNCYIVKANVLNPKTNYEDKLNFVFAIDKNGRIIENNFVITDQKFANSVKSEEIDKLLTNNEMLLEYSKNNKTSYSNGNKEIISIRDIYNGLKNIASVEEIDRLIKSWAKEGLLKPLNSREFVSDYRFEYILSKTADINTLSQEAKEKIEQIRKKESSIVDIESEKPELKIREAEEYWSDERKSIYIEDKINQHLNNFSINKILDNQTTVSVDITFKNPKFGHTQTARFSFEKIDNKLGEIISVGSRGRKVTIDKFDSLINIDDKIMTQLVMNNSINSNSNKIIINTSYINKVLSSITGRKNVEDIIEYWLKNKYLVKINSNEFASENSLEDILFKTKDKLNIDLIEASKDIDKAVRNFHKIKVDDNKPMDSDTRNIESKEKELSPQMIELSNKLCKVINSSLQNKKITSNKAKMLIDNLELAKEEKDLENIWKELKQYIQE